MPEQEFFCRVCGKHACICTGKPALPEKRDLAREENIRAIREDIEAQFDPTFEGFDY